MELVLFTNGCPKCKILEERLDEKNITYISKHNPQVLKDNNLISFPALQVNEKILSFYEAICFLKEFDFEEVT